MLTILLVALSVGLDNFAASIAIGLAGVDRALRLRIGIVFGAFEAGMPVVGLLIGRGVSGALGSGSHYVAGGLLIAAGAQVAFESLRGARAAQGARIPAGAPAAAGAPAPPLRRPPLRRLVLLGGGLSIDNLVVGFALGAQSASLALAVVTIGVVSVALSLAGLELGSRLGERVEHGSELLAAAVLAGVGLAIVLRLL